MEKSRYPSNLINENSYPIKTIQTSNSLPNNEPVIEESLIPSDLLNESEYDFYPKKMEHYHPKSQSPSGRPSYHQSSDKTFQKIISVQEKNNHQILIKADVKLLISQLKTHYGSIRFQNSLSLLSEKDINSLLIRLCPYLIDLMCSHFGNYFIQKLFQKLNYNQKILIFSLIQYNFIQLCTDKSGTYSIQALIDAIKTPNEEKIIENLLKQNLLLLICNENSHHIIQKIIIDFPEHKREFLSTFILDNIDKISTNEYGALCMIKFIIMNSNLNLRQQLIKAFEKHLYLLLSNKYSCSVLLFVMEKYGFAYSGFLINEIKKNIIFFSTQNTFTLVEKAIELLFKFDNSEFNNLSWTIIKSDKIVKKMYQSDNGKKILFSFIKRLNNEQKNFFLSKKIYNVINDQVTYETIMHLLL